MMNPLALLIGLGVWIGIFLLAGGPDWNMRLLGAAFILAHGFLAVVLIRRTKP